MAALLGKKHSFPDRAFSSDGYVIYGKSNADLVICRLF